jgi:hypothetical protein
MVQLYLFSRLDPKFLFNIRVLLRYKVGFSNSIYNQKKSEYEQNIMSVKFNEQGTQICALRCKSTPILYDLNEPVPVCVFDSETFLNACTIKSCCFAGDTDQVSLSIQIQANCFLIQFNTRPSMSALVLMTFQFTYGPYRIGMKISNIKAIYI